MEIVLDTNALESDRYAARPLADAAWRGAAAGDFRLVIPDAVIVELAKHFPVKLQEPIDALNAALTKHGRELDTFGLPNPTMPDIDVPALCAAYESELRARCSEQGCRVEPSPDLRPALDWSIQRRKPFDANGHGLPDAAVWLTVLDLAERDDVILVTNNHKDFGKPGQLRPELRRDLEDRNIPDGRVRIVADLYALRWDIVEPAAEATARATRLMHDPATGPQVTERLINALRQSTVSIRAAELDFHIDDPPTIADIEADGFTVSDARELAEGELLVQIQTRADVLLDMVVWRGDYVDAEYAGVALDTFDPDDNAFNGELRISADLSIEAVIRLDGSVEEATIADFERLPGIVELQRRIDQQAGQALIEHLGSQPPPAPQVSGYLPPEPLFSSVEEATVEDWRVTGGVFVESVADRDPDGIVLQLQVEASADITWLVSAPDPQDLDRFTSLAEGVEDGGGFLHDIATDEPVILTITAKLTPDSWEDIEIDDIALTSEVRRQRADEVQDAEDELNALLDGEPPPEQQAPRPNA